MKDFIRALPIFLFLALLSACSGSGGKGSLDVSLASSGSSGTSLVTDAAALEMNGSDVEAVYLTIEEVRVHLTGSGPEDDDDDLDTNDDQGDDDAIDDGDEGEGDEGEEDDDEDGDEDGGGWVTVATPNKVFNLLDLRNCLLEKLGSVDLTAGRKVTQIRLVLGETAQDGNPYANYVVIAGEAVPIKVPSGTTSGLKINPQGPVEIEEDGQVHITLRIDLEKSLVFTGNGKILLKPVIKAETGGVDADAFISGTVTASSDGLVIEGARVSAQVFDSDEVLEDQVRIENAATTDTNGEYRICVAPGTYNLVAVKEGFETSARRVTVSGEETVDADFELDASDEFGTVAGIVTAVDIGTDDPVTLSFRQKVSLDGQDVVIEIASIGIANGESYSVSLAPGDYDVVASAFGVDAFSTSVTVESATETDLDITF
jgi:hypothetical protein